MKSAMIAGVMTATILIAGCGKESSGGSITPLPVSEPVTVSGSNSTFPGSNTFFLGATAINGTNVSTNVTVEIRTREASK